MQFEWKITHLWELEIVGLNSLEKRTIVLEEVTDKEVKNTISIDFIKDKTKLLDTFETGDIVKVSIVGVGMRSHAGVASKMFTALAEEGINILMISTSEIKISVIIEENYLELAVRCLHTAFGLDREHGESSARA